MSSGIYPSLSLPNSKITSTGRCAWFLVLYVSAGSVCYTSVTGMLPTEPSRQPSKFLSMVHYSLTVHPHLRGRTFGLFSFALCGELAAACGSPVVRCEEWPGQDCFPSGDPAFTHPPVAGAILFFSRGG